MYYCKKDMKLEEYFNTRMIEDGFYDKDGNDLNLESIDGYYRTEVEYNIIADYVASCGLEKCCDIDFLKSLNYSPKDFVLEDEYDK